MNRSTNGPIVLFAFGALMVVQALLVFAFEADLLTHLLLAGTALAPFVVGAALLAVRAPDPRAPQVVPAFSLPTALAALGLAALAVGASAGPWMLLIGAGLVILGAAGVVRERRSQPR